MEILFTGVGDRRQEKGDWRLEERGMSRGGRI